MVKTREEAIDENEHELIGIVFDAWIEKRDGHAFNMFMGRIKGRLRAKLGAMYDEAMRHFQDEFDKLTKKPEAKEMFESAPDTKKGRKNSNEY